MSIRTLLVIAGLGEILLGPMASSVNAQNANLEWEMVGDPLDAEDFGQGFDADIYVLDKDSLFVLDVVTSTFHGLGETQNAIKNVLPLSVDTFLTSSTGHTARSTNGGESWTVVFTEGGELFTSDLDGPNSGALLTQIGDSTGAGYSHDRGATWHRSEGLATSSLNHECESFEEIRSGPFAGRLVAGCLAGMAYSDDRGVNWSLSNIWVDFTYNGVSIITAQNGMLYARLEDPEPGFGLWSSSDGATWTRVSTIPSAAQLVGVEGGPAPEGVFYAVGRFTGEVHRSLDAGQTWEELTPVYSGPESVRANAVIVGPDDKLYVAVTSTGPGPQPHDGVYRTTESVIVANEPDAPPTSERLVVYPNPARNFLTVEPDVEEIEIVDVLGRVILRAKAAGRIDVSGLPAGVYVVRAGGLTQRITLLQ